MALKFQKLSDHGEITFPDPPLTHLLFSTTRFAWLFTAIRVYLGYNWVTASLHKINDPAWVQTGEALKGFWVRAVAIPEKGSPAIAFDWYRGFIQYLISTGSYSWFGKLIAYGEFLVGIGLIVGAFVGIAAFFGGLMNWNFIMAGAASSNGLLFTLAIILILAWKVAGYYGLDYFLLPMVGTPWGKNHQTPQTPTPMRA